MNSYFRYVLAFVLVIAVWIFIAPVSTQNESDPQANKETLIAFHEAEAARDYDSMDQFVAENFVRHSTATSAVMPDVMVTNRDQYIAFLQETAAGFPDYVTTPRILVAEEDYVAFVSNFTGKFVENGNRISMPMSGMVRFENGLMAEMWIEWDNLTWNMQMTAEETPVASMDDVAGVWTIYVDSKPYRLEYTADGNAYVGFSETQFAVIENGTYAVEGNQIIGRSTGQDCEGVYDAFVTRQADGKKLALRLELVGEDCNDSRREALAGQKLYPFEGE